MATTPGLLRGVVPPIGRRQMLIGAGAAIPFGAGTALAQGKPVLPALVTPGVLTMSINPTLPPLQFVDEKGVLRGMRVELADEVAKWLGLKPEYVRTEFSVMVPGLAARRWDMINTGIYWTEERSKIMYMVPYEQAAISFLVSRGNPLGITKWQDLAGRSAGVELGGIEERRTREISDMLVKAGLKPLEVRTFNNFAEAFQALRAGQVDAATSIDATAMYWQSRGDFTRAVAGLFPQTATFAFASKPLADAVVAALNDLRRAGVYDALFDRYGVLKIEAKEFAIQGPGPA